MPYRSKFATKDIDMLFQAILELDDIEACYRFFEDLSTIKEINDMAQRMKVAKLLSEKVSYHNITLQTNASTATISRVNKALHYGADGYLLILEKLKEKK